MAIVAKSSVHDAIDSRFPAPTPDDTSAVNGDTMPRQAYALVIVHENLRMLLWQVAHLTHLTQKFPLADAHTTSILQQFSARLDAVREALAVVVTPAMQAAIDVEVARFEASMQRYNKQMRRQWPATTKKVRHAKTE